MKDPPEGRLVVTVGARVAGGTAAVPANSSRLPRTEEKEKRKGAKETMRETLSSNGGYRDRRITKPADVSKTRNR